MFYLAKFLRYRLFPKTQEVKWPRPRPLGVGGHPKLNAAYRAYVYRILRL